MIGKARFDIIRVNVFLSPVQVAAELEVRKKWVNDVEFAEIGWGLSRCIFQSERKCS